MQPRGARAQPPSAAGGDAAAPRGFLELGGPFPSRPRLPLSPAGGPGRPAAWGRRSLATTRAGGSHQRGDSGDFGAIFLPGLQILQSKERRVVQTERVGLDGVVEALLEGVVLQLQHEPARLLPLRLPLLRRLPPAPGEGEGQHRYAPGTSGPPAAGPQPSREPRPAQSPSASRPVLYAVGPASREWVGSPVFIVHQAVSEKGLRPLPTCTPGYCGFANNKDCFFCGIARAGRM